MILTSVSTRMLPDTSTRTACALSMLLAACGSDNAPSSAEPPTSLPSPSPVFPVATPPSPPRNDCVAPPSAAGGGELVLRPWLDDAFERPVAMVQPPHEETVWYVVEQRGSIHRVDVDGDAKRISLALDWRDVVVDPVATDSAETGLLGLAFHPDHPDDRRVFVYATLAADEPGECPRVAIAELDDLGGVFDPTPRRLLLEHETNCVFRPDGTFQSGHNAGTIHFDPRDGTLVAGIGDLSRERLASDPESIEGTLLRLDVDAPEGPQGRPGVYVPSEVVAFGLRNPWKWSFDRASGEIWLGDVGLTRWEEIDRIEPGASYGWPSYEGSTCRRDECEDGDHRPPVFEYDHGTGCSVVGGYVYRGARMPDLRGTYVFGDWCAGLIFALRPSEDGFVSEILANYEEPVVSFAESHAGELFVIDYNGSIDEIVDYRSADRDDVPRLLSETGCTADTSAEEPSPALVPFDINVPFWSDGATKRRWISIPPGARIHVAEDGDLFFPPGSVLMKEFRVDGDLVETRLLMHHATDGWRGYAYAWNGDDAELVPPEGAAHPTSRGRSWQIPARLECPACHTARAGFTLGPELAQLDRPMIDATGRTTSQLSHWIELGLLDATAVENARPPDLPPAEERPNTEAAARAYLHVNCAPCHRPGARTYFPRMDLRATTSLAEAGICATAPTRHFAGTDMALLSPGEPERSVLKVRAGASDDLRMPPLASEVVDTEAVDLLDLWIRTLASCPGSEDTE